MSKCTNLKNLKAADVCCQTSTNDPSSYCTGYSEGQIGVCHGHTDKCSWDGNFPPKPHSCIGSVSLQDATKCCQTSTNDPGSYCTGYNEDQIGVCHGHTDKCSWGKPTPPKPTPPKPTPPKPTPPKPPKPPKPTPHGSCSPSENMWPVSSVTSCNADHWEYCRNGVCVTRPIPNEAIPAIQTAGTKPSLDILKQRSIQIHSNHNTIPGKNWIPAPLNKTPNNGKYRLTLWHEGFAGYPWSGDKQKNNKMLEAYFGFMIDFVRDKQIDRVFLQSGDPALTDNYGDHKYNYADIDFVVENYLSKLPANTTAGLLAIVDPRYTMYYDINTTGGIWGNNPDYKNTPSGPNFCQAPYRECSISDKICAGNIIAEGEQVICDPEKCKSIDPTKQFCVSNQCSKYPACDNLKDYGGGKPACLQFEPGCPNNIEQFFKYVGDLNKAAKKVNAKPVTTIALDGEDLGMYGTDQYGLVQLWQAARKYAPDVNEIGYAHGPSTNAIDNWTNAAYPELYWIGELKKAVGCIGCKSGASKNDPACQQCMNAIYQKMRNNPSEMLDAMSKYITHDYSTDGVCPLFSLETAHFGGNSPQTNCIANVFNPNANFCGTFDGFGNWSWDAFSKFLDLFAQKYNTKDIGIYEFQFLPLGGKNNDLNWFTADTKKKIQDVSGEIHNSQSNSYLPLLLGILASIGLLMIIIFKIHKHNVLKEVLVALLILSIFVLAYFLMKSIKK